MGLRASKQPRTSGMSASSPMAQQNSSKSIGSMSTESSSEGMRMSSTFFLIDMREPVSM